VACVVAGEDAFEKLVTKYQGAVMSKALESARNRAEAQDAAQATFTSAYQKIRQFRGQSTFATWLFAILKYELIRRWKKRVKTEDMEESLDDTPDGLQIHVSVNQPTTEERYREREEFIAVARDILDNLPERESRVCNLVLLAGFSEKDASDSLGVSIAAVRMALMRGREKLQRMCVERGSHA